jgi:hypothetical protein
MKLYAVARVLAAIHAGGLGTYGFPVSARACT